MCIQSRSAAPWMARASASLCSGPAARQFCHNPDTWHKRNGRQYTIDRVMKETGKYVWPIEISCGGLKISGGEPVSRMLSRPRFFAGHRDAHLSLDTSGFLGSRLSDPALADIELQLLASCIFPAYLVEAQHLDALKPAQVGADTSDLFDVVVHQVRRPGDLRAGDRLSVRTDACVRPPAVRSRPADLGSLRGAAQPQRWLRSRTLSITPRRRRPS